MVFIPIHHGLSQVIFWEFDDLITDIRESGARSDVTQDQFGNFYMSYWQPEADRLVYGTRFRSTLEWQFQFVDSTTASGYESAIAINEFGHANIAYFENRGNQAYLTYATNETGTFELTTIEPDSSWGIYGPSPDIDLTTQASIDIIIMANGQPAIVFFDRRLDEDNIVNCDFNSRVFPVYAGNYELDMKLFVRQENGEWVQPTTFDVPYESTPTCLVNTGVPALDKGDRFGEFCQFGQTSDGRLHIVTTSMHNHQLLLWSATDATLSSWERTVIDSVSRIVPIGNRDFRLSFDFVDFEIDSENNAHLVYGMGDMFGLAIQGILTNASDPVNRSFFYTRIDLDSLGDSTYQAFHHKFNQTRDRRYRNNYSISTVGQDSIIVTHYDVALGEVVYHISPDQGLSWDEGMLASLVTNSPIQSLAFGDSLYVWMYDAGNDHILQATTGSAETSFQFTNATVNEVRANELSSFVERQLDGVRVHFVYDEVFRSQLLYGLLENDSLETITVDDTGLRVADVVVKADDFGNPYLLFSALDDQEFRFAQKLNGVWQVDTIVSGVAARDIQLEIIGDSVHIVYFDGVQRALAYTRGNINGDDWVSGLIDNSAPFVGQGAKMAAGKNGHLHVAYTDPGAQQIKFAERIEAGTWRLSNVTAPLGDDPSNIDLKLDSLDRGRISYLDASNNSIFLLAQTSDTSWVSSEVVNELASTISGPVELELDSEDRPWIVYNIFGTEEELRLIRRNGNGVWRQVSIGDTGNELSSNVNFHIVDADLFVLGKKNRVDNEGIGLLTAEEGITTDLFPLVEADEGISLALHPNPAIQEVRITVQSDIPQKMKVHLRDLQGRFIQEVVPEKLVAPGIHEFPLRLSHLSPGMYIIVVHSLGGRQAKRLMIIR